MLSDDGAILWIDDRRLINLDGARHSAAAAASIWTRARTRCTSRTSREQWSPSLSCSGFCRPVRKTGRFSTSGTSPRRALVRAVTQRRVTSLRGTNNEGPGNLMSAQNATCTGRADHSGCAGQGAARQDTNTRVLCCRRIVRIPRRANGSINREQVAAFGNCRQFPLPRGTLRRVFTRQLMPVFPNCPIQDSRGELTGQILRMNQVWSAWVH